MKTQSAVKNESWGLSLKIISAAVIILSIAQIIMPIIFKVI